jgi:hypothetical protein
VKTAITALACAVVATVVIASAASGSSAQQRLVISAKDGVGGFTLAPQAGGILRRDTGSVEWCCWSERFVTRDGQRAEINDPQATLIGDRGTLVLRFRIEWLDAGRGYTVGTSTWKVVRGTGAYKGVTGGGRAAQVWIPRDVPASFRADGFVKRG